LGLINAVLPGGGKIFGRSKFIQKKIGIIYWHNNVYYHTLFYVVLGFGASIGFVIIGLFSGMLESYRYPDLVFEFWLIIGIIAAFGFVGFLALYEAFIEKEREYLEIYIPYFSSRKRNLFKLLIVKLLNSSIDSTALYLDDKTYSTENAKIKLRMGYGTEWILPNLIIKLNLFVDNINMYIYIWPTYSKDIKKVESMIYHNLVRTFKQNGFKVR
jgi:hypothetical protein